MTAYKTLKRGESVQIPDDEPVYTSGVVTRLLGIPVWVLKQLDKEAVVKPPRKKGRYRFYSRNELKKLEHIWYYMNKQGVNVHGVRVILEIEAKLTA